MKKKDLPIKQQFELGASLLRLSVALESETDASEAESDKEYKEFINDTITDKASKNKDIVEKTGQKASEETNVMESKRDLEGTQKELDAALAYFDKLKHSCIDTCATYDELVAKKSAEIASLRNALLILTNKTDEK